MRNLLRCLIACLLIVAAPASPQGFTGMFPGPGTPASSGGCASNGPLDVVSETGIEAVGLRALKKSYNGNVILISTAGTTGTYNNVGLSGCDLNTSTLSACTGTSAPTTTVGCPIETFYDQSGNGCNPTQATGSAQAWLVLNQANSHPTVFFGGSAFYTCTLGSAKGTSTYAGEFNITNTGSNQFIADIGNGSTYGTLLWWSQIDNTPAFNSNDGTTGSNGAGATNTVGSYATFVGHGPNSAGAYLLINNNIGSAGSSVTTILTGTSFVLGAFWDHSGPFQGKMGELVILNPVSGCTTTGDCGALYTNMSTYW